MKKGSIKNKNRENKGQFRLKDIPKTTYKKSNNEKQKNILIVIPFKGYTKNNL